MAGVQLGVGQTPGAASPPVNSSPPAAATPVTPGDLEQLRETIAQQQEQIKRLQESMEAQQKLLEQSIAAAKASAAQPGAVTADGTNVVATSNVAHPSLIPALNRQSGAGSNQKAETGTASPLSISIGNTTLTPFGFVDATFFSRSTNVGSGIGTNFLGIPYNNVPQGHLSETNFSAQNSRVGFRVDSNFLGAKILGYFEADFLFNNDAGSYQITSNSAGFRMRNYFVDAEKNGFEVLAGQDWSMLTPNRKGISPLPSDIFFTQDMDTNYQVGLVWTRAPQFRFIAHPNENVAIGVALENPQQYIGGGSGASVVVLPNNLAASVGPQFNSGQTATGDPNWFPDIQAKVAFDGKWGGKAEHLEIAGVVRGFKDYVAIKTPPAIMGNHTAIGYGGEVNANLELLKGFRAVVNTFASDGGGRYIFGTVPDVVIRPDGTISPLHAYSTVDGFEAQVSKNTLLYSYYGGTYAGQNVVFDPTAPGSTLAKPVYVGYGYPKSGQVRYGQEITGGLIQTFWKNPNYGALSLITQYSYLFKEPWAIAAAGGPKQAHSNLIYIDLRYTLP
jgi:hypothetical protein